ncbi:MAG: hypothetical protein WC551_05285 [Patescibacteria group bacterium]
MEERNPLTDFWPAIAIAAVVTVSILVTVLWMQREEMKLTKQELMATKVELLDVLSKKVEMQVATSTVVKVPTAPTSTQPEVWNGEWMIRNKQYEIAMPTYKLECLGKQERGEVTRTRLVKMGKDGSSETVIEDIKKAGMDATCDDVFLILEPKGSSKVYFVVYEPPSVGPTYGFDPATKKFTQAKTEFFAGRRLDYVISPDQRYIAQIGTTDEKLEARTIAVYDVVKDSIAQTGKLKAGSSYTKSLWLFNSMASGEPVADLSWAPDADLKARVYSSKVPLLENGTCGVEGNPEYKCFERKPTTSVEPMK